MMELLEKEASGESLRRMLDGTRINQADIAAELGLTEPRLSRILNGRDAMPEDFPARWKQAVQQIAREQYERALSAVGAK